MDPQPVKHTGETAKDSEHRRPVLLLWKLRDKLKCDSGSSARKRLRQRVSTLSLKELCNALHNAVSVERGRSLTLSQQSGLLRVWLLVRAESEKPPPRAHFQTPFPGSRHPDSSDLEGGSRQTICFSEFQSEIREV